MMTARTKLGLTALVLALSLGGCDPERSRWSVTLQPDGSGSLRLVHETAGDIEEDPDEAPPAEDQETAELARLQAARFLSSIDGVTAWTDITATPLSGGRTRVEATGWFRSLADVKVLGEPRFSVTVVGQALEVEYRDPLPAGLSDLFLAERDRVQQAFDEPEDRFRASLHRTRGFVEMSLAGWEFDLLMRLPGVITDVDGFERAGGEAVALHQDVETVLGLLDADLQALRDVRADVRQGALDAHQGYAELARRLADGPAHRVRSEVVEPFPDPNFDAAFEQAVASWDTSEWRRRIEEVGQPK